MVNSKTIPPGLPNGSFKWAFPCTTPTTVVFPSPPSDGYNSDSKKEEDVSDSSNDGHTFNNNDKSHNASNTNANANTNTKTGAEAITTNNNTSDTCPDKYPSDTYSFLALYGPKRDPSYFCFGLMVFLFQFTFLTLMMLSVVKKDLRSDGEVDNPDSDIGWVAGFIPANVSRLVRATQVTSILYFMVFADESLLDVAKAVQLFPKCFQTNEDNINTGNIVFACILRFVQGVMAICAVFLLVMTTSDVIEIVLNFTAVNFISALDENAFKLAQSGKFGPKLKKEAAEIEKKELPKSISGKRNYIWCRLSVIPIAILLLAMLFYVTISQEMESKWITSTLRVQFQDSTDLDSYSGCYEIDVNDRINKRYVYNSFSKNAKSSKFGYCRKKRHWLFFEGNASDPCDAKENELAHSSMTSSFDVSTSFGDDWFSFFNTPLDMYFIQEESEKDLKNHCGSFVNDGNCDLPFNNYFYQYDGGDCCAATCTKSNCGYDATTNETIFPECEDPDMVSVTMSFGTIEEIKEDRSWWADFVLESGWDAFWKPLLILECDGKTALSINIDDSMANRNETAMVNDRANCTMITKYFDLVLNVSYTVSIGSTTIIQKIQNRIPSKIGNLTDVSEFDLNDNSFTGTIPSEIGLMANLTKLSMERNSLSGTIPSEVGVLTSLTELSFSKNSLTGSFPSKILMLTKLVKLNLDHNSLTGSLPSEIALLTSLTELTLSDNSLTGIIPSEIKLMTNLKKLNFGQNSFVGTLRSEIGLWVDLEELDFGQNSFTGTIPREIQCLTDLTYLNLGQNSFNDTFPSDILLLTNLTYLNLGQNSLYGTFPSDIVLLTDLTYIDLGQNSLIGTFPSDITSLRNLTYIDLYGNDLKGTIPSEIGQLIKLTHLELGGNDLNGTIPSQIGLLSNLISLDLGQNSLIGTMPTEIGSLTSLIGLWMYYNYLNGTIPCQIGSLSSLSTLNLNFNYLKGPIPSEVKALESSVDYLHVANQLDGQLSFSSGSDHDSNNGGCGC